jgi:hypothetical protein
VSDLILTAAQLIELTKKQRASAQCKALDVLCIPYRKRPDGSPVVFTSALQQDSTTRRGPQLRFESVLKRAS